VVGSASAAGEEEGRLWRNRRLVFSVFAEGGREGRGGATAGAWRHEARQGRRHGVTAQAPQPRPIRSVSHRLLPAPPRRRPRVHFPVSDAVCSFRLPSLFSFFGGLFPCFMESASDSEYLNLPDEIGIYLGFNLGICVSSYRFDF
jgi:hypothetical protein